MEISVESLIRQSIDQQRILLVGNQRKKLSQFIRHILSFNHKAFNFFSEGQLTEQKGAPVLIIESDSQLSEFEHHVLLLSATLEDRLTEFASLADATPKGGTLIYPEADSKLKSIGTKERADVQPIPYTVIPHEIKNGVTTLITSTNEKFPLHISGDENMLLLAAAKELLKKIGISSSQFYKAAATLS
jgi:UDP-N-acetylmuramate: L-alanyl-gamma-D-glutamyl-meso-diaminopimelate ligase